MKMTKEEYADYVKAKMPRSPLGRDMLLAFLFGGGICCIGQAILDMWKSFDLSTDDAAAATCISMIFLGALCTGLGFYDKLAKYGGAGTLVPITGFANAVCSPALEFRTEGVITGTGVKIFTIAGPVIVCGVGASWVYGLVYWVSTFF